MTDHMQSALIPLMESATEVEARSTREAANEAFAWQCLKDALSDLVDEARDRASRSMVGDASEKQGVINSDGDRLGTVSYTPGVLKAEVVSKAKLLAYVKENYPSEVYEEVRPQFIMKLMGDAVDQALENGVVSGEVIPGINVGEGNPVLRIVKTKLGRETGRTILKNLIDGRAELAIAAPASPATCGTCVGTGEVGGEVCPACSIRPHRCGNCDHLLSFHGEEGCRHAMITSRVNVTLVCGCMNPPLGE